MPGRRTSSESFMSSMCVLSFLLGCHGLNPFQTELGINTHVAVVDIRHDVSKIREEICGQVRSVSTSQN